ncbi:hypothetical protein CFC21_080571 [Triticum aestivum]|uniref:Uncharacterized protein n=2 Tax=Triticum aestivum TaxID=4565 RepID=A0A3B6MZT3_WHEAT|nr:hypothetical protein CFC21_080571 [Triticum aestivum]
MAAVETGEVVKATALAITSPAGDMKSDGTQELQPSPANVSLDLEEEEDDEEPLIRSLQYDLWMRLIVAHHIQKLKLDMKKDIDIHRSLLRDNAGESDRLRRSVLASLRARESEPDDDDGTAEADVDGSEDEEEHQSVALREFRDLYARASDVDRRFEEFDAIMWAHYDPDLEDNETRKATVARLWRRLEKELDDRADAVVSGAFNYSFAPLTPRHQSLG